MPKKAVNDRFIRAVNHLLKNNPELKKKHIAEKMNISPSKFSEILNERMNVGIDSLSLLAKHFNINPRWLLTGNGEMIINLDEFEDKTPPPTSLFGGFSVPFISKYSQKDYLINNGEENFTKNLPKVFWEQLPEFRNAIPSDFLVFEMVGVAMDDDSEKKLQEGDLLLGKEVSQNDWNVNDQWENWNYALILNKEIIVTRILNSNKDGTFKCHPINELYDDFELPQSIVMKLYRIIRIRREWRF